jgi:hypothetical protein
MLQYKSAQASFISVSQVFFLHLPFYTTLLVLKFYLIIRFSIFL